MIQDCPPHQTEFLLKSTPEISECDDADVKELTLRALFEAEETPLLRYAFSLTGRRAVAEDIVQEVFLQLHVRWEQIDSPRAWLFRSVRNRAINHLRNHRREILRGEETMDASSEDESPESALEKMEAGAALRNLIDELGERDRQLVKLKYFENLKYRDISERTGLSISNVGYRLHHLLKELAEKLSPLGIDKVS